MNRSCSGLFFPILSLGYFLLRTWISERTRKKILKICWLKLRELWICLGGIGFGYIFVYWSLVVPSWLGWLIETGCQKQDETRCWPVSSRWQHEASHWSLAAFRFIKLLTFHSWFEAVLPKIVFCDVFSLQNVHCLFLFRDKNWTDIDIYYVLDRYRYLLCIFRCFIGAEYERQFCFIVLATYFSFQLF